MKVTRYTRAGREGKYIICPHCTGASRVYHFSWSALYCMYCKKDSNKYDWEVAECHKT